MTSFLRRIEGMLIFLLVIAGVVLFVLFGLGIFRKPAQCEHCGKMLKGTEQRIFGKSQFVLCDDCAAKIPIEVSFYGTSNWEYSDYVDYLKWEEETKEERAQFKPDYSYGNKTKLLVDTEHGLFSIKDGTSDAMVYRFADLNDYELNFRPEEVKEGLLGDKITGTEYVVVDLNRPKVYIEEFIKTGVRLKAKKKGFIKTKYEYELTEEFLDIIRAFTICIYIEIEKRHGSNQAQAADINEIEKALALFMFDSMDEVTKDSLKRQRNALIKAFHPDNDADNDSYSQKINAAYELLDGLVENK